MTDLDRQIEEALAEEDRRIVGEVEEMGLWSQLASLFQGKMAWMSVIQVIIGTVVTFIGFYAAYKFIVVDDLIPKLEWGALAWALFTTQIMIKLWSWMRMEHNRTIREVKRVELQLALLSSRFDN